MAKNLINQSGNMCEHRRIIYPSPSGDWWKIECSCGWNGKVSLAIAARGTVADVKKTLERLFVEHVPPDKRRVYVKVDRTPGHEGQWLMPEGVFCTFGNFRGDTTNGFFADVESPITETLPVAEVTTEDGRVFRWD